MRSYSYKPPAGILPAEAYMRAMQAVRTFDLLPSAGLRRLASNWPREFSFHAEAIKVAVWRGVARDDKRFKKLRATDFEDIHLGPAADEDDSDDPREREREIPTRQAIADAEIAGAWWAALAIAPENVEEFRHAAEMFRRGRWSTPWVDDQRILAMQARGASLRTIGANLKGARLNEHQTEGRIYGIAETLARIANGPNRAHGAGHGKARSSRPR